MIKFLLLLPSLLVLLCFQMNSCEKKPEEKWVEMGGPNHNTSIVLFFKKNALREQISEFHDKVLSRPSPYGANTGLALPDGVAGDFQVINSGFVGIGINFAVDATSEQREELRRRIRESPIVYKVYENVVPSQINDL